MNSCVTLPEDYREIFKLDLQKDKRTALLVNGLALGIFALLLLAVVFFVPFYTLFDFTDLFGSFLKLGVLCLGTVVYTVLHEAVHGIFMRRFCEAKVKFGFTGLYAFAGSQGYYCKRHYIIIALAPIVVWGVVLAVVNALVPIGWFYVVFFIQAMNLSGAAGDLYVSAKMRKLPATILVQDTGVAMTVFDRAEEPA